MEYGIKKCLGIELVNGFLYTVSRLRGDSMETLTRLSGGSCSILWGSSEGSLVSSGDPLYLVSGGVAKLLLKASRPGNWFWHACEGDGRPYVQEYGVPPTEIYVSEDMENFRRVLTNVDSDPRSRYFHYMAFDERRNALVATLDDSNLTRVVMSLDHGRS